MAHPGNLQEQIAFFAKNDYCFFPNVLSREECDTINAAVDRNRRDCPGLWGSGARAQSSHCILGMPECDYLIRHPAFFPLARAIVSDVVFSEFGFMFREGGQQPELPSWHQDCGINEKNPYDVTALSAIFYLTDVDQTSARYTLIPGSHKVAERPNPVTPDSVDVEGEVEMIGEAGSCIFVNAGIWHAGKVGTGPRERRTAHIYLQPESIPQFSPHNVYPRRLWDVPDPEQRRFFSHFNALTRAVASEYAPPDSRV